MLRSLLSREFGRNQLTTQATATSAWWILPNVALARMRPKSFIQTFLLPLPSTTLPRAASHYSHSPEEGSTIFRRQQQVRQRERYWRSRLRFHRCVEERRPYFPNQKDVNDLIRDLGLTKSNAELLISRLKQWNLMDESVQIADQRKRHEAFSKFFSRQDGLCFCNNVACLFEAIHVCITCNPSEWRLFIDSSSRSLKAVLLHNGNNYPTLPMAHSVYLKEHYTIVKMLLSALKYVDYGWEVTEDFKMVSFLMSLQGGFTKFPCFLSLKNSITKT